MCGQSCYSWRLGESREAVSLGIYLDYNATTPVDRCVADRVRNCDWRVSGNASSSEHAFGWDASEAVEEARLHVAELINASLPIHATWAGGWSRPPRCASPTRAPSPTCSGPTGTRGY